MFYGRFIRSSDRDSQRPPLAVNLLSTACPPAEPSRRGAECRGEELNIDIPDASAHKLVRLDEVEDILIHRYWRSTKSLHESEIILSVCNASAGDFADDRGMTTKHLLSRQCYRARDTRPKVIDPYRRIGEDQLALLLRRGTSLSPVMVPPDPASRIALSRAMSDSSPIKASVLRSRIPVSSRAPANSSSWRFIVVRMILPASILASIDAGKWCDLSADSAFGKLIKRPFSLRRTPGFS